MSQSARTLGSGGPVVSAVGLGAMPLSIAGRPPEPTALETIHAALDHGVTLIDTADAYCLDQNDFHHNERLIAKALRGRSERVIVATKAGCRRPGGAWTVDGRPEALTETAHASLAALGQDAIDLLQLHAPDTRVPFAESVGALARLREAGKVRLVGLSNVTVEQVEAARAIVDIASVQNRWNPLDRSAERSGLLAYCTRHGIAFLPYSPFGGMRAAPDLGLRAGLAQLARKRRMSPHRLLLAWMLAKGPTVIPIPGARRADSIMDSAGAAGVTLSAADVVLVDQALS